MKKGISRSLTHKQVAELNALAALPDNAIDTSDAAELPDWSDAKRGLFYRPVKQQLTLRLDADVIAWFRTHTPNRTKVIRRASIVRSANTSGVRLKNRRAGRA